MLEGRIVSYGPIKVQAVALYRGPELLSGLATSLRVSRENTPRGIDLDQCIRMVRDDAQITAGDFRQDRIVDCILRSLAPSRLYHAIRESSRCAEN